MAQFLIRELMTPTVASVHPDASLVEAARVMCDRDIGDVLLVRDSALLGVMTDRDIVVRAVADGVDPFTVNRPSLCTAAPVCVGLDDQVSSAVRLMYEHAIRRLPVVDSGRPVGMVSLGDVAREQDPHSVLADISRAAPDIGLAAGPGPGPSV